MKTLLLLLLSAFTIGTANAQIIITGIQSNPYDVDNNYEYIQLQATQDINFATNNYSLVTCLKTSAATANGWATGGLVTYKFNLISGSVAKGQFFYVGGSTKLVSGVYSGTNTPSMASANWITSRDYSTIAGDGFGDANPGAYGILANGNGTNNAPGPSGVAVFSGTTVTNATVPIDVVFFGDASPVATTLTITNNDRYSTLNSSTSQPYFGIGTNTYIITYRQSGGTNNTNGAFLKLSGSYNVATSTWTTPRSFQWIATGATGDISSIEGSGLVVLPVALTDFTTKAQGSSVQLNWTTASETNNSHFDVLRSADGLTFSALTTIQGQGDKTSLTNYNYADVNPFAGTSYYQLLQVDRDGKSTLSEIRSATVGAERASLKVYAGNGNNLQLSVYSLTGGKTQVHIADMRGNQLAAPIIDLLKGFSTVNVPVYLQSGVYVATLQNSSERLSTKFLK